MNPLIQLRSASVLLALAALLFACKKDDASPNNNPTPAGPVGGISGRVVPSRSVREVFLSGKAGLFNTRPDSVTGQFTLDNISVGRYLMYYTPAPGFLAPNADSVSILANTTFDLGPVTIQALPTTTSGSYKLNGSLRAATYMSATLSADQKLRVKVATGADTVLLYVTGVNGTGIHPLINGGTSAIYKRVPQFWSTDQAGGSGTIAITSFNSQARKISGTFQFLAPPVGSGIGSMKVTEGKFFSVSY